MDKNYRAAWRLVPDLRNYSKVLLLYLVHLGAVDIPIRLLQGKIFKETGLCRGSFDLAVAELTVKNVLVIDRTERPFNYTIIL